MRLFEKLDKIENLIDKLSKKKESSDVKIRNENGGNTTSLTEIKRIIIEACEKL